MFAIKRALKLNNKEATLMAKHAGFRRAVSQWFPSSKTCSSCGHIQNMPLNARIYECPTCGMSKDRDLNAAINILNHQPSA